MCELIVIPYGEGKGLTLLMKYCRIFPFAELMGLSQNMCFYITCVLLLALLTQFEFKYNPFNGLNERAHAVLQMTSGSLPPERLGLTIDEFERLVNSARIGLKLIKFHYTLLYPIFILVVTICLVNSPLSEPFSIINALFFMVWT